MNPTEHSYKDVLEVLAHSNCVIARSYEGGEEIEIDVTQLIEDLVSHYYAAGQIWKQIKAEKCDRHGKKPDGTQMRRFGMRVWKTAEKMNIEGPENFYMGMWPEGAMPGEQESGEYKFDFSKYTQAFQANVSYPNSMMQQLGAQARQGNAQQIFQYNLGFGAASSVGNASAMGMGQAMTNSSAGGAFSGNPFGPMGHPTTQKKFTASKKKGP